MQSRDHAGKEKLPYRLLGDDAEYDEHDAGRYDAAEASHRRDDAGREPPVIAVPVHLGDRDAANVADVAADEPQIALNPVAPITVAMARPPGMWPTNLLAAS